MATEPTSLVLDGRAEYVEDGDVVLVSVFVVDPSLGMGFPGYVKTGHCSLLYRNTEVRRVSFDRRFGNGEGAEGDFIFQFLHPSFNRDMRVQLEVEAPIPNSVGSGILKKTIPVTLAEKVYIPLSPTLDTGLDVNDELRSKARLEEEV